MSMDLDTKGSLLVLGLLILAVIGVYAVAFKPLPVYAEEAELIYDTYNGSNLDLVIRLTDRIEQELPATGQNPGSLEDISAQRDLLVLEWERFESLVVTNPISSVSPLELGRVFSAVVDADLSYQAMVRSEMGAAPSEALGSYIEEGLGFLNDLMSRLSLVYSSVRRYHNATQ